MENDSKAVLAALKAKGLTVCTAKGGGFWTREGCYLSLADARKLTEIIAPKRILRGRVAAWGDWGMVAAINRVKI